MTIEKAGRNDPCPCGSGAKFKKCCIGELTQASPARRASARTEVAVRAAQIMLNRDEAGLREVLAAITDLLAPEGALAHIRFDAARLRAAFDSASTLADQDPALLKDFVLEQLVTVPFAQRLRAECDKLAQREDLSPAQRESAGICEFMLELSVESGKPGLIANPIFGCLLAVQHSEYLASNRRFAGQMQELLTQAHLSDAGELKVPQGGLDSLVGTLEGNALLTETVREKAEAMLDRVLIEVGKPDAAPLLNAVEHLWLQQHLAEAIDPSLLELEVKRPLSDAEKTLFAKAFLAAVETAFDADRLAVLLRRAQRRTLQGTTAEKSYWGGVVIGLTLDPVRVLLRHASTRSNRPAFRSDDEREHYEVLLGIRAGNAQTHLDHWREELEKMDDQAAVELLAQAFPEEAADLESTR